MSRYRGIISQDENSTLVPFSTSGIRADDNTIFYVEILTNPSKRARFSIEIVHWNIEKALDLARVKVHSNHVITTSSLKHIGHELSGNGSSRFVLFVLACVWEVWNHSCDPACRCRLTCVDHDQQLHEGIIDVTWWCRLQDEDCMSGKLSLTMLYP